MDHRALDLTQALIARRSLTPDDAGCQALLQDRLSTLDFKCQSISSCGVDNTWARRGNQGPLIVFAGHTDVVPSGPLDGWVSDPFSPTLSDGYLYGRGAADMKASLAAFIVAIEDFVASTPHHAGSIGVLLTSDEEGMATDGTVKVVEALRARGETIDYCVVGEPTSVDRLGDMIKNGRRGSLSGTLIVRGIQAHIAYPHLGKNPIHLLAPALSELAATEWDQGNDYFPPTTWQVSNLHAGTGATNIIPGELTLQFNFRYATASSRESLQRRVEAILERYHLNYELTWPSSGNPYLTPRGKLLDRATEAIQAITGITPDVSCTGGTSDGRFIADICPEVIEVGPINATIHKLNERIAVADLEPLAAIYRTLLERTLLGQRS